MPPLSYAEAGVGALALQFHSRESLPRPQSWVELLLLHRRFRGARRQDQAS